MARIQIFCGPCRSPRAGRIDALLKEHWGRALLVTPTHAYATHRRDALLSGGALQGAWGRPVRSFSDFAAWLLTCEGVHVRRITDAERRMLMDRCLHRVITRGDFAGAAISPENSGLAAHLLHIIAQLKQAAIEPDTFRERLAQVKESSPLDPLVAAVYAEYQQALLDVGVYDVPGLYWEAVTRCEAGPPRALSGVELVAFDGFDDFTPSEFRLLKSLSRHIKELVIGLNCELRPSRRDLYELSVAAADRLAAHFGVTPVEVAPAAPRRYSEFVASVLFWRDPPIFPESLEADLTVVPCADVEHEIETIARRVKRLLLAGATTPDRIAVVFRNLAETAPLLRSIFGAAGVPVRVTSAPRLIDSALGAFLLRLFDAMQHWERDAVVETLASPWFCADQTPEVALGRDALEQLSRAARIIAGRDEWHTRLQILRIRLENPRDEADRALLRRMPDALQALHGVEFLAHKLMDLAEHFAPKGAQRAYAQALDALLLTLAVDRVTEAFVDRVFGEAQYNARTALDRLIATLADACDGETLEWPVFLGRLEQGMRETPFDWPDPPNGVLCCDPLHIRNLSFDYVFFGGLVEGIVPMPAPADAIYPESDRVRLRNAGIVMEGRREHSARERMLFHHVLQAAEKGVTLSWPVLRPGGRETVSSQFLSELLELFYGHGEISEPMPLSDCFVPRAHDAASWRDLRNAAFLYDPELRGAFSDVFAAPARALQIEQRRHGKEPFDAFDGMLDDPATVAAIARQFGPEHCFSVNQIECYVKCPFRFFADRLLRVEEEDAPDEALDPLLRGLILHETLQRFHERFKGVPLREVFTATDAETNMMQALDAAFDSHAWRNAAASRALIAVERERMAEALRRYIQSEATLDESWRAMHFELAFGPAGGEDAAVARRHAPFVLETEAGPVNFSGRMDRVDQQENALRVVDYKAGAIPGTGEIISGESLQLTVYAWALTRHLFPEASRAEALYISVGKAERRDALGHTARSKALLEPREANAMRAITEAVCGIRAGAFPPYPTKNGCNYCDYRRACRYDQTRIEYKTGSPRRTPGEAAEEANDYGEE